VANADKIMKELTLQELRVQFEDMAKSCMFDITRSQTGEYEYDGRNTFILWAGYWECAKINGIIPADSDALKMNALPSYPPSP